VCGTLSAYCLVGSKLYFYGVFVSGNIMSKALLSGVAPRAQPQAGMWYAFSVLFGRIQTVLLWRFCQRKYHEQSTVING
ncbi:MAG: hypothetical protein ACOX9E_16295, partial [Lentisphaeria bacterium]